ncbi:hypothetical protein P152DRAFT_485908 [Eremomyces bilateralis CBS 781.70]|uniref:Uncharacterized protein n=1 Tax=Eremomyces bilateralis CBS 781.70 TaxID=1392243 RepID=A0A6G1FQ92_9PEZI|nr:uncharacterized protein P152DRAFT_485908 [Eremomyces bilateralis CBS 781.70]KAF1807861.1 hypothetical protein P152DRAFT_485908 [Eremomyces bilateralis CBS 781.70]
MPNSNGPFEVSIQFGPDQGIFARAKIDTGATVNGIIEYQLAKEVCEKLGRPFLKLRKPIVSTDWEGKISSTLKYAVLLPMTIQGHYQDDMFCYVSAKLGDSKLLIGDVWLAAHGVLPDASNRTLWFKNNVCDHPGGYRSQPNGKDLDAERRLIYTHPGSFERMTETELADATKSIQVISNDVNRNGKELPPVKRITLTAILKRSDTPGWMSKKTQ